jgi:hypothetical protein
MNEEDWKTFKSKMKYWLFGEINFNTRWKILMWVIQYSIALILLYYVILAPEFRLQKTCIELRPAIEAIQSGEYVLVPANKVFDNKLSVNQSEMLENFTAFNYSKSGKT